MKRYLLAFLGLAAVLGCVYILVRPSRAIAVVVIGSGEDDDDGLPSDIGDVYPEMLAQWAAEARARRGDDPVH